MRQLTMKTPVWGLRVGDQVYDPMGKFKLSKEVISINGSTVRLRNGPRSIWITASHFDRVISTVLDIIR